MHSSITKSERGREHNPAIMNGIMPVPGLWSEARNADGRVYYYNTQTKATQWTKPTELMTPAEVCRDQLNGQMSFTDML
jgi:hypothetical protein